MNQEEHKKVLIVIGMEHKLENIIRQNMKINPESILLIHGYRPDALEPFGHLMREIIVAVYMENIEEIYLVSSHVDKKKDDGGILNQIYEKIGSEKDMQTLDYLFKNCTPEFPNRNLKQWLEGGKTLTSAERIDMLRKHPLMPSNVKVTELLIQREDKKIFSIE
ncbi:carbonic anhydrase [Bacillus sp. DNRA2]|uniref:carbonic anhydrase n=1 Tax=Bacillus sp. DNRA2 TaxID=2723053 RepID=UPI00145CD2A4|nr:carbonic anhydrase [Bacillus sp. DNRA2]NMD69331.1 carbonic anhydrase [Bacillus sp. DNRA2]